MSTHGMPVQISPELHRVHLSRLEILVVQRELFSKIERFAYNFSESISITNNVRYFDCL